MASFNTLPSIALPTPFLLDMHRQGNILLYSYLPPVSADSSNKPDIKTIVISHLTTDSTSLEQEWSYVEQVISMCHNTYQHVIMISQECVIILTSMSL